MLLEYQEIFNNLIGNHIKDSLIYQYTSHKGLHEYAPFYHFHAPDTEKKIGQLMRQYIYMYAYSENEVIEAYKKGRLKNLEKAALHALRERLPNRSGPSNGLYSELFLDLILSMYYGDVNKLATRAIYRQRSDNQEIKGYDGLHIVTDGENLNELWLGQAKMGSFSYCFEDIQKDLTNKTNMLYASEQLYFVADKERSALDNSLQLLDKINEVSWESEELNTEARALKLRNFFIKENIKIVFPCLLAYSSPKTYEVHTDIIAEVENDLKKVISKFDNKFGSLLDIDYKLLIWFIPIRDIELIRKSVLV